MSSVVSRDVTRGESRAMSYVVRGAVSGMVRKIVTGGKSRAVSSVVRRFLSGMTRIVTRGDSRATSSGLRGAVSGVVRTRGESSKVVSSALGRWAISRTARRASSRVVRRMVLGGDRVVSGSDSRYKKRTLSRHTIRAAFNAMRKVVFGTVRRAMQKSVVSRGTPGAKSRSVSQAQSRVGVVKRAMSRA